MTEQGVHRLGLEGGKGARYTPHSIGGNKTGEGQPSPDGCFCGLERYFVRAKAVT